MLKEQFFTCTMVRTSYFSPVTWREHELLFTCNMVRTSYFSPVTWWEHELLFTCNMVRTWVTFWWYDGDIWFVLVQKVDLDFNANNSLKQQTTGRNVAPLKTHLESELIKRQDLLHEKRGLTVLNAAFNNISAI